MQHHAFQDLIVEVFRLNGALISSGDAMVRDLGLSSARWQVLGAIMLSADPLTVAGIARDMGLTRQGVQRTVNDLIRAGLVRLDANPAHRRARLVVATRAGQRAYAQAMERNATRLDAIAPDFDPDDLAAALRTLCRLRRVMEAQATPPPDDTPRRTPNPTDRSLS